MDEGPLPVSWDEGREIVAVVLVAAAVMSLVSPIVGVLSDARTGWDGWDDARWALRNVNVTTGVLLVGAAVAVCTVPAVDVVPRLKVTIAWIASIVAVLGVVTLIYDLVNIRDGLLNFNGLETVLGRSAPGTLLAATAAWLARRVVAFPD